GRPPGPAPFPYTTLFRSRAGGGGGRRKGGRDAAGRARSDRNVIEAVRSGGGDAEASRWGNGHVRRVRVVLQEISLLPDLDAQQRSEEHTSELQSPYDLVC